MWNEFNIKTIRAETVVFRDGVLCDDLSTLKSTIINKKYDLPVHIIYVGKIAGDCRLNIDILVPDQPVILSVNVKNDLPAFLNIFIKNTGKNSELRGNILLENNSTLDYTCTAQHNGANTTILLKNKLIAGKNTKSRMSGTAIIGRDARDAVSDVAFSAIADKTARIEFTPAQRISIAPQRADHSASIYRPTDCQIEYLRESGLGTAEVATAIREAFMNDF